MKIIKTCILAFGLMAGASANSAIINFDFSNPLGRVNTLADSFVFHSGGYTLTATASSRFLSGSTGTLDVKTEQFADGLGVRSFHNDDLRLNSSSIIDEKLIFVLTSIGDPGTFFRSVEIFFGKRFGSRLQANETAEIRFGFPQDELYITGPLDSVKISTFARAFRSFNVESGQNGNFVAGTTNEIDNGFRIKGVAIDVPEPATAAILGLALLGLGFRRFKTL